MPNPSQDGVFYRRRLPHVFETSHPVFLTWRLKFDLPGFMRHYLLEENRKLETSLVGLSDEYIAMQRHQHHKKMFGWTDEKFGTMPGLPDLLKKPELAAIIKDSIHFHESQKYLLHAYCIMPNHVHLLVTPQAGQPDLNKTLASITQSLKRFTARQINLLLQQTGALWASESYDHLVRSEEEFARIVFYIMNNPVKAGLVTDWRTWQHSWLAAELQDIMAYPVTRNTGC